MSRRRKRPEDKRAIVEEALRTSVKQAADRHRVSERTIRRWLKECGISGGRKPSPHGGIGTSVPSVQDSGRSTPEPTLDPDKQLKEAMGNAAAKCANSKPGWFHGRLRDRRAIKQFDTIISNWERDNRERLPRKDGGGRLGGTGQSESTSSSAGSTGRHKIRARRSNQTRRVYVFDAKPVADLAAGDPNAWKFLREIADGRHEMVVPEAVAKDYETNNDTNSHLREVLGCKYLKRVASGDQDKRAARVLCEKACCTDIVQASVVIAANNCFADLRKRHKRGAWSLEVVTCVPDVIRDLVRLANLTPCPKRQHRGWCLLPLD